MLNNSQHRQKGLSIIEVLIGLAIALLIMFVVIGIFVSNFDASNRVISRGKLDRDLSGIMDIIVSDIQRAGYWTGATNSGATNPFMTATNSLTVNPSNNCITFAYDNGSTNVTNTVVSDTDRYGYGLSNGAIKFRQPGATFNCSGISNWSNLSDTNAVTITGFTVTTTNQPVDIDNTNQNTNTINYQTVTITLTGNIRNDSTNSKTITRTIKVYNNKYSP